MGRELGALGEDSLSFTGVGDCFGVNWRIRRLFRVCCCVDGGVGASFSIFSFLVFFFFLATTARFRLAFNSTTGSVVLSSACFLDRRVLMVHVVPSLSTQLVLVGRKNIPVVY